MRRNYVVPVLAMSAFSCALDSGHQTVGTYMDYTGRLESFLRGILGVETLAQMRDMQTTIVATANK